MRKNETGALAPVPGYFTSQMLQMEELVISEEMPAFDIVEYGETARGGECAPCYSPFAIKQGPTRLGRGEGHRGGANVGTKPSRNVAV